MQRSLDALIGYTLSALDGEIGRCKDFLFDDDKWVVRYMVADTGKWISGRRVLLSPVHIRDADWSSKSFGIRLSREQIENAPSLSEDAPVSARYEAAHAYHYGYYPYWAGSGVWGVSPYPGRLFGRPMDLPDGATTLLEPTTTLRSAKEVRGYHIRAVDGEIGHVDDFIVSDDDWRVRYLVVDTRNWLPGKKVLVSPDWVEDVKWAERQVVMGLSCDAIKDAPEFDEREPVNREFEKRLYDYYGRPYPW